MYMWGEATVSDPLSFNFHFKNLKYVRILAKIVNKVYFDQIYVYVYMCAYIYFTCICTHIYFTSQ
jgi:hypothetical protein